MSTNTEISRDELIGLVKTLILNRSTNSVFVTTDDNHSLVIGVEAGQVVSLICGGMFGEGAIPAIRDMVKGTYRLVDKPSPYKLPITRPASNESLLSIISGAAESDQATCEWVHDVLCKVLARYIGPIAPVVCRETISAAGGVDSPDKMRRVVKDLATEIGNAGDAERFKAEANEELDKRPA